MNKVYKMIVKRLIISLLTLRSHGLITSHSAVHLTNMKVTVLLEKAFSLSFHAMYYL